MVESASIGVLGIQGAISEHVSMVNTVYEKENITNKALIIRNKTDISQVQGLIIPGGESTTISRFLINNNLHGIIKKRVAESSLSVMGTCAGCILIAQKISDQVKDIIPLELIDIAVLRNAFGRQRESFEKEIHIKGFDMLFPAVFIRAPIIEKTWGNCQILSKIDNRIIMVKQGNILGLSFHPELTNDVRIHQYFLQMVLKER